MLEHIERLLAQKEYSSALIEVQKELSGSFDLNDSDSAARYEHLLSLQQAAVSHLAVICDKVFSVDEIVRDSTKRSSGEAQSTDENQLLVTMREAVKVVEVNFSAPQKTKTIILTSPEFGKKTAILSAGEHYMEEINGEEFHYLVTLHERSEENSIAVQSGLKEILHGTTPENCSTYMLKVANHIETEPSITPLVLTLLFNCIRFTQLQILQNNFIRFFIALGNERHAYIAHSLLSAISMSSFYGTMPSASRRDVITKSLAQACKTNDAGYIKILSSVATVIDQADVTLLLTGETGSGKSFLARTLHTLSDRAKAPFEEVNCGALNGDKLYSTLFGWEKGAFTGADREYKGKILRANGGTLFLDEIDRATKEVRNALLLFIETKKFERLRSEKTSTADIRLIFGTNKNLKQLISKGLFEEDFYMRINQRMISLPPLRLRPNDIDIIVDVVMMELSQKSNHPIQMASDARSYLKSLLWPGNIRQLIMAVRNYCYDVIGADENIITLQVVRERDIDGLQLAKEEDLESLTEILSKMISAWSPEQGKFLEEIIEPILSHLYMNVTHTHLPKTNRYKQAYKIIGINGDGHNDSKLANSISKFKDISSKLNL